MAWTVVLEELIDSSMEFMVLIMSRTIESGASMIRLTCFLKASCTNP